MSEKPTEFEAGEPLRAIGKVEVPEPRVLDDARAVLWSAVTSEMFGIGPAAWVPQLIGDLGYGSRRTCWSRRFG